MLQEGTKVRTKDGKSGIVTGTWKPHDVNPKVFTKDAPDGYEIIDEDGLLHVCIQDDFTVTA